AGSLSETADAVLQDISTLKATDLKQLGKALELEVTGAKAAMVETFRLWLTSGGTVAPLSAEQRAEQEVAQHVGDLVERMRVIDAQVAEEVIRRAEIAAKELSKEAFEAFGNRIGIPVKGTKAKMLQQIKDFVNRAAVSHAQTQF